MRRLAATALSVAALLVSASWPQHASGVSDSVVEGNLWPSPLEGKAAYDLGVAYLEGRNGPVDEREAARWLSVAASSHVPEAELELSFLEEEQPKRLEYLRDAVSHGLPEAEFELGVAYAEGEATLAADLFVAIEWLTKSAEKGFAPAFYRLGLMHLDGEGIRANSDTGCGLIAVAVELALDAPVDELLGRCRDVTPEQQRSAEKVAEDWLSRLRSAALGSTGRQ